MEEEAAEEGTEARRLESRMGAMGPVGAMAGPPVAPGAPVEVGRCTCFTRALDERESERAEAAARAADSIGGDDSDGD